MLCENTENVTKQAAQMIISCLEFWNEFLLSTRRTHNVALASDCQLCDTDYRSVWFFFFFFFCCVSWWPMKSIHSKWLFQGAVTAQTLGLHPVVCDASNQPTSGSDRHQSATDFISPSMTAHIRDGRYHPQDAICSTFHLKMPLPSLCLLGVHLVDFRRSRASN